MKPVSIAVDSVAEGERVFSALAENETVSMPFAKTFWSPASAWSRTASGRRGW